MRYILLIMSFLFIGNSCSENLENKRVSYVKYLYHGGEIPKLWVPLLSHFSDNGKNIDTERSEKHN